MKRTLLLSLLLLLSLPLMALSYSPDVSFSISSNFTKYAKEIDSYGNFRSVAAFDLHINPLAITTNDNGRISLPFGVEYLMQSTIKGRERLLERLRFDIELEYNLFISSFFAISISPGVGYTYFPKNRAGSLFMSFEASPLFLISDYVSLSTPIKALAAKSEIELQLSLALSVYPFGIKEDEK